MPFTSAALNIAVDAVKAAGTHISLHTGDPGTTGANPITGARRPVTWGASTNGDVTGTVATAHDIAAGETVSHWGIWTALTGGTFLYGGTLPVAEGPYGAAGQYQVVSPSLDFD